MPLVASAVKAAVYSLVPRESSGLAINRDDAARTGHLELMVGIMWDRIESSKHSSSEKCMIITAKRDDVED